MSDLSLRLRRAMADEADGPHGIDFDFANTVCEVADELDRQAELLVEAREALTQAVADFEEHASFATNRLEDGDELGSTVWRLALTDIKQEALDNALRARATLAKLEGE